MFSQSDLIQLVDSYAAPCLSLFMPTHASGPARRQDEIRLKNLLRKTEQQLDERDVSSSVSQQILNKVKQLVQDPEVWRHRSDGLAVYCSTEFFRFFMLPLHLKELVVVDDHFHVSPLIPLLHSNGRFFVLALTKDSADLYESTRYSITERGLPTDSSPTGGREKPPLQYHSHQTGTGVGSTAETIYHGQGGADDREKADITNFFKRQVDPGVTDSLRNQDAPLVLVCVNYLESIYRGTNSYPHLVGDYVSGSPAELDEKTMREQAWEVVAPVLRQVEVQARDNYENLAGSDRTQTGAELVVESASRGRIDTLFVPTNIQSEANGTVPQTKLIEDAAQQTLLFGGRVLAVDDVPGDAALAAVLRY